MNFDISYFAGQNNSDLKITLCHSDDQYLKQSNDLVPQIHKVLIIAKPSTEIILLKHRINKGDNINARDLNGLTILHLAILFELSDVVSYSINAEVDIDAQDTLGRTALHLAAMKGNQDIVKLLVDYSCNVNSKDHYGNLPLHTAVSRNHTLVADFLIKLTNNITPLIHIPILENDTIELLECLILTGDNIDAQDILGRTALHLAAMKGNLNIVKLLVDYGCDINSKDHYGNTPIHKASINNDIKTIEYLIKMGADLRAVTATQQTALHLAVINNNQDAVKLLVTSGADINAKNMWGVTPIILSIIENKKSIIEYLYDNGAIQSTVGINQGIRKLHLYEASKNNLYVITDPYNYRGVIQNIESKDHDGKTALCLAAEQGKLDLVKWLVGKKKANIEVQDNCGNTPLHAAVIREHVKIVKYLVNKNANILTKNIHGRTPFYDLIPPSKSKERTEIFKCLVEKKKTLDNISLIGSKSKQDTFLQNMETKYAAQLWLYYKTNYTFCPTDDNVSVLVGNNTFELLD